MEYIRIVDNDNFNNLLNEIFGNDYAIGIHGINNDECYVEINGNYELNYSVINSIKLNIFQNGLNIKEGRHLLSTVMFENLNNYVIKGNYDAGGIIIGIPKVIKSETGEEIFVGSPIDHNLTKNRN